MKDTDEERVMHSKSDNIEFMIYYFFSHFVIDIKLYWKYQLEILSLIKFMYYKCYKINPSCGGSYKDSSDWIKNKKSNNKFHQ